MVKRVSWAVAAVFLAVMVYLVFFHVDERDQRLSGDAVATVYDVSRSGKNTRYHYRYTVGGTAYEGSQSSKNLSLGVGRPARVCYDPQDPSRSNLKPMSGTCGSGAG